MIGDVGDKFSRIGSQAYINYYLVALLYSRTRYSIYTSRVLETRMNLLNVSVPPSLPVSSNSMILYSASIWTTPVFFLNDVFS